jgi:hypothetical protein
LLTFGAASAEQWWSITYIILLHFNIMVVL